MIEGSGDGGRAPREQNTAPWRERPRPAEPIDRMTRATSARVVTKDRTTGAPSAREDR